MDIDISPDFIPVTKKSDVLADSGHFRNYVKIYRQAEISSRYIRAFGKSIIKIQSTLAIKSWEITYSFNENIKDIIQEFLNKRLPIYDTPK